MLPNRIFDINLSAKSDLPQAFQLQCGGYVVVIPQPVSVLAKKNKKKNLKNTFYEAAKPGHKRMKHPTHYYWKLQHVLYMQVFIKQFKTCVVPFEIVLAIACLLPPAVI